MGRPKLRPGDHGAVSVIRQPGGKWQARTRYCYPDGAVRSVTATAKRRPDAEWELDRKLTRLRDPDAFGVEPDWTVKQLAEAWLRRRTVDAKPPEAGQTTGRRPISPQTLSQYSGTVRNQVVPRLGAHRLRDITVGVVDYALVAEQREDRSTGHMRTVLNQMFAFAVRHGAIQANPMQDVEQPPGRTHEVHALTPVEARALRALARRPGKTRPGPKPTADLPDFIDVALATGARVGEILALTWGDLDLTPGKPAAVRIAATMVVPRKDPGPDGTVYVDGLTRQPTPKSRRSRVVLIPQHVAQALRERRVASRHKANTDHVFAAPKSGSALWPNNVRTRLRNLVKETEFEGVTPHTLRRTVGTALEREHGIYTAGLVLGHKDGSVTARHYVAEHEVAPDVRATLEQFFTEPDDNAPRLRAAE